VRWIKAKLADGADDLRAGAIGHAGLVGLNRPSGANKFAYKSLKVALATLARTDCRSLKEWESDST